MRRPDLPLLLLVIAAGIALALFAEPRPPEDAPTGLQAPAEAPDVVDDFFADFDPVFVDCFGDVQPAAGSDALPRDPERLVAAVSRQVERIRELRFERDVKARFLDAEELRTEVEGIVEQELPAAEIRREEQVLKALGALDADADLAEITTEAFGSQVAGLYDTKSEDLLVGSAEKPSTEELVTLAHELDHALTDQALGLLDRTGGRDEVDRALAYSALVEGDATLAMEIYALRHVGLADELELGENVPAEQAFEALPDYVQRSLLFPYLEGLRFVCHRYAEGGWRTVNRALADPPEATSQVIFPDRYGVIEPIDAKLPAGPGPGWAPVASRELGAAELEWLFRAPGGDPSASLAEPRKAVFGWAGGRLEVWRRDSERALAISLVSLPGTDTLCGAVGEWYRAGWPESEVKSGAGNVELEFSEPGRAAVLACDGVEVRLGVAPSAAAAFSLAT